MLKTFHRSPQRTKPYKTQFLNLSAKENIESRMGVCCHDLKTAQSVQLPKKKSSLSILSSTNTFMAQGYTATYMSFSSLI